MTSMSSGVDSLTDISYKVRAFFDEVTLAYRSLNDTQRKIVDGLSDGLIDGLKMLAVAVTAQKAANVAGGLLNLANAVTSFGDAVNKAKAGKAGSSGGALSKVGRVVLYAELVNFALDNLNPEAAKNRTYTNQVLVQKQTSILNTKAILNQTKLMRGGLRLVVLSLTGLVVQLGFVE